MHSFNGFTRRLELAVPDPGLPGLIDGCTACLALAFVVHATGPAAWWPGLIILSTGALAWRRRLADQRRLGPVRLILTADDRWLVQCRGAGPQAAVLGSAWLAGPCCGLQLLADDGRRWRVYLFAGAAGPDQWRHLRVRLRLPRPPALT